MKYNGVKINDKKPKWAKDLPDTVIVDRYIYDVIWSNTMATKDCLGISNVDELTILLDNDSPESVQKNTFMHEIIHVAFNRVTAVSTHSSISFGKSSANDIEHYAVYALTDLLRFFIMDNPEWVRWLS